VVAGSGADPGPGAPGPTAVDRTIVYAVIHPAIGVARVGNSPDEFFIGPEVIDPPPAPPGFYRDPSGALKRQAARFRIYGYNAAGEVVGELTPDRASIRWGVHVANAKAAWYQWQVALDVPEAAKVQLPLRNAGVTGDTRKGLIIDGGLRRIEGKNTQGPEYAFRGRFQTTDVYLGELRTDADGRLLFLGGHGVSSSPTGTPIYNPADPNTFINADGWYDDMSDGPVTAEVSIEGRRIPVEPAWVVAAPPNYGPMLKGVRTLYDLLFDLFASAGWFAYRQWVSFRDDVYPILKRLSGLQWSNQGFAAQFGPGGPNDFEDLDYVKKLAAKPAPGGFDTYAELRLQVLHSFRDPAGNDNNPLPWPWIYGDAVAVPPADTPRQNATVSPTQYNILLRWVAGQFEDDWSRPAPPRATIEDVPLGEQPAMLDRAALEFCLADAFHPGCEVTWPIRHLTMFSSPFRIRHRPADAPEPDYGPVLTPTVALSIGGPLHAQGPGDLTRWMGLPWQADTGSCRSGYSSAGYNYDPYIPTFWPARVPNQVLIEANYAVAVDPTQPEERRLAAFSERFDWNAPLEGTTKPGQMDRMVKMFGDMGVLEVRPGVEGDPNLPATMMVASFGSTIQPTSSFTAQPPPHPPEAPAPQESARAILHRRAARETDVSAADPEQRAPLPVRYPR
jgi:hypothetical protein